MLSRGSTRKAPVRGVFALQTVLRATGEKVARRPVSRVLSACFHGGRPFLCDPPRGGPVATNPNDGAGMPSRVARKRAAAVPIRSCSRWGLPCHPCCQGRGALLPHRFALTRGSRTLARAVCFLWHFPWGRPRRPLAGTVFPWSPDFPLPREGQRPSSRLASARHGRHRAMRQVIPDRASARTGGMAMKATRSAEIGSLTNGTAWHFSCFRPVSPRK